jgi:hypothetical protein
MTAPTLTRSSYPAAVEALIPQARDLAAQIGEIPSRNRLMKEFRVGAPKALALREALTIPAPAAAEDTASAPDPADNDTESQPANDTETAAVVRDEIPQAAPVGHPGTDTAVAAAGKVDRRPVGWPVLLLALPAFVAIWSGWVSLGELSGFGIVHPLPGIADSLTINTAITLPIGVETYAAYALWVWLSGRAPQAARKFARASAIGSLIFGAAGQVTYHLMAAAEMTSAPWQITAAVACLPVAVLGMGAALAHLLHSTDS